MNSYGLFEKLFENNTDDELIKALDNGLDFELEDESYKINFYTAALSIGSPEVVRACIRNGASMHTADMITLYRPFPLVSTLNIAMTARRADILKVLLEEGANPDSLFMHGIAWNLRNNSCPDNPEELNEAERENLSDFKHSLDEGTKIIDVFKNAGVEIPGLDYGYTSASFFDIDYNADILQENRPLPMREVEAFFETSLTSETILCPFPCQGTRTNALWHFSTPTAMKEALKSQNPDVKDKAGWTTLHHIAMYGGVDYYLTPEKIVQVLIDSGANVNAVNKYNVNPLMIASAKAFANEKMFEVVKTLIRNGADYNSRDKKRCNARKWLMEGGMYRYGFQSKMIEEVFNEIIKSVNGIGLSDIDLDLFVKVLYGKPKEIEIMLSKGADINSQSGLDYTPLMMASVFNDPDAVRFLLEHGADVSVKNSDGETALSLAAKNSNIEIMSLIIEHGGNFDALRWIDRNYYTKCTQTSESSEDMQVTQQMETLREFGLNI